MIRVLGFFGLAVIGFLVAGSTRADAQMFVTSVTAAIPDPNGKVPAFDAVPDAGITTWSNGLAQAVLVQGHYYNYCVSLASTSTANGHAAVRFTIRRGTDVLQTAVIIAAAKYTVSPNGVWYYCSGYTRLPASPGAATLVGSANYTPKGSTKSTVFSLTVPIKLE